MLLIKMQELFLHCLNLHEDLVNSSETQQKLRHVLKSYALLSKQKEAEQLYAESIVKPYMLQVNL